MRPPYIRCKVSASCDVLPSEDPGKVRTALSNVLPGADIHIEADSARATADDLVPLEEILMAARLRRSRAFVRLLKYNTEDDSTWFLLNKQAAFAGNAALCGEADESPLGPIRVILKSHKLDSLIEWLSGADDQQNSSRESQKF